MKEQNDMMWVHMDTLVTVIAAARLIAIQTKEQLARITKNRVFVL